MGWSDKNAISEIQSDILDVLYDRKQRQHRKEPKRKNKNTSTYL